MEFWAFVVPAVLVALATAWAVGRPLLAGRGGAAPRAAHDMQVFRDQLAALDQDVERGILAPSEAESARVEVSRRLLAAAAEAESAAAAAAAPRRASMIAAAALALTTLAGGGALYLGLGTTGAVDQPLVQRLEDIRLAARDRIGQAEAERRVAEMAAEPATDPAAPLAPDEAQMRELVAKLQKVMETRPDDLRGYRLLVNSLRRLGDFPEARAAQDRVLALLGDKAGAEDYAETGEMMILAARGYVSPEAEAAISRALELDPTHSSARFYAGLSLSQNGRSDLAISLWLKLLRDAPAGAPWAPMVRAELNQLAARTGTTLPPFAQEAPGARFSTGRPPADPGAPGPSGEDVAAAAQMTPEARQDMIRGMVAQLEDRIASEGGAPEEWSRLITAYGVLDRPDDAARIWADAKLAFADKPETLDAIRPAARRAGVLGDSGE